MRTPFGSNFPGTLQTNPGTAVVLTTTGDLAGGRYLFQITATATSNAIFNLELLDASNVVVQTTIFRVAANQTIVFEFIGAIDIQSNYELRVRPRTAIIGGNTAAVSIEACLVGPIS